MRGHSNPTTSAPRPRAVFFIRSQNCGEEYPVTIPKPPQISVGGKTTSLGDHDLEGDAARTFDLATINRQGVHAKLNFPAQDYAPFFQIITTCSWQECVSMLR